MKSLQLIYPSNTTILNNVTYLQIGIQRPLSPPISEIGAFENYKMAVRINGKQYSVSYNEILEFGDIFERNLTIEILEPNNPYLIVDLIYKTADEEDKMEENEILRQRIRDPQNDSEWIDQLSIVQKTDGTQDKEIHLYGILKTPNAVTIDVMAENSVNISQIVEAAVTEDKIGLNAVTPTKISLKGAVTKDKIDSSVIRVEENPQISGSYCLCLLNDNS